MSGTLSLNLTAPNASEAFSLPPGSLDLTVYGRPAPQGSKRIVPSGKPGGKVHVIESGHDKVQSWRQDVRAAAREALREAGIRNPLDGPLIGRVIFTVPKPASAPKRRRTWPATRPDCDKLLRAVLDALKSAGAIIDDAQFVNFTRLAKVYPGEDPEALDAPGARITVAPVGGA